MPLAPCGIPLVVTVHDVAWLRSQRHARGYARAYFGPFALARYRTAAAVFVDSAFSRDELLSVAPQIDPQRVRVAYPGVARDFCQVARSAVVAPAILVVGTVERRKNLETIVRALPSLPDARIVSVGPFAEYRDECRALAKTLGVADRVEFRGYVSRDALLELYATCAVAAIPSRYEGFGYALAQALCAGLPCVAADAASLPEVAAGDARLLPVDDVAAWSAGLAEAMTPAGRKRARAARSAAIARFAWPATIARVLETYRGLINR